MTEQVIATNQAVSASESSTEMDLLRRLRDGEDAAFGELFELHSGAVRRLALGLAADRSEAEDIAAETFFRVLQALRRGAGPREHVRAYLLTVARRVSWEWHGSRRDVPVSDDELTNRAGAGVDSNASTAEYTLITSAFSSLPERWRTVLWQTEVEGEQPAVVAPHFGLSPNATAALARRARLGLRAAYLQAHLKVGRSDGGCRSVVEKLGAFTAGSIAGAEGRRIRAHLGGCRNCRSTHDELRDVCSSLRAHAGAVVLLVPAAGLAFGGSSGVTATTTSAAASTASAATGGSTAGFGAAAKGAFLSAKMKVGLALASTAAVGAIGISVAPVMVANTPSQPMGLHGQGAPELVVAPPAPTTRSSTAVVGDGEPEGGPLGAVIGEPEEPTVANVEPEPIRPVTQPKTSEPTRSSSSKQSKPNRDDLPSNVPDVGDVPIPEPDDPLTSSEEPTMVSGPDPGLNPNPRIDPPIPPETSGSETGEPDAGETSNPVAPTSASTGGAARDDLPSSGSSTGGQAAEQDVTDESGLVGVYCCVEVYEYSVEETYYSERTETTIFRSGHDEGRDEGHDEGYDESRTYSSRHESSTVESEPSTEDYAESSDSCPDAP